MTTLAHKLGIPPTLSFHDVFSLTEPDLLALIPRPAHALLFVCPCTPTYESQYEPVSAADPEYSGTGAEEPVMFYRQTIHHACGLIGLLHCTTNGAAASEITPDSDLAKLIHDTLPLEPVQRAQYLHDSAMLEKAHSSVAQLGDTIAPPLGEDPGHAFIAFVKGKDGCLYELEGRRKGPTNRGALKEDEDVLSQQALEAGPLPFLRREEKAFGVLNFSCTVLAPAEGA